MTVSELPQKRPEEPGSDGTGETSAERVSLYLRLWTYGGPSQPLSRLALEQEPEIAELIRNVVGEAKGAMDEPQLASFFSAFFDEPLMALTAAKALQQGFLSYHRHTEPQQVVPCVLICKMNSDAHSALGAPGIDPDDLLGNLNSARILVAQSIYELAKSAPGFRFSPTPVREAGQTGDPEAIYELLWTDESTYGHLRQAIRARRGVGRYQLQEEIGRGAMGTVYKAYDQLIGRTVALKVISIDRNTPERDELLDRLKQEAKAAGKLDHTNIITIYDVGEEDELVYLSMQFVEGKTLQSVLAESGVTPLSTLISWVDQILSALGYAHAHGVIHRDLKPANLMLTTHGVIKVLDFGIAKLENTTLTKTGLVVGTPSHMAPEQVTGRKVDPRTDIFALGSVFYEMVTREKPFRGDVTTILYKIVHEDPVPPSLVNPALPGAIDAIIRKALAKDPNDRYQSCDEMRQAFLEQAALLNIRAAPPTLAGSSTTTISRPPASFSLHLIESAAPRRSMPPWAAPVGIVALSLVGASSAMFYVHSHPGFVPVITEKLAARAHRIWAYRSSDRKTERAGGQPSTRQAGDHATLQRALEGAASAGASSPADTPGGNRAAALPESAADSTPISQQATTQVLGQSAPDGTHALSTAVPSLQEPAHEPASSLSAPDQPVKVTSGGAMQANNEKQPAAEDVRNVATGSAKGDSTKHAADFSDESQTASTAAAQAPKKMRREAPQSVEGFTRHDVPELLREADAAEGRGDYRLARYSYKLILKLEPTNSTARSGLHRVDTAAQSR